MRDVIIGYQKSRFFNYNNGLFFINNPNFTARYSMKYIYEEFRKCIEYTDCIVLSPWYYFKRGKECVRQLERDGVIVNKIFNDINLYDMLHDYYVEYDVLKKYECYKKNIYQTNI